MSEKKIEEVAAKENKEAEDNTKMEKSGKRKYGLRIILFHSKYTPFIYAAIVALIIIFSVIVALINIDNEKIYNNISIMGVDVSGMTVEEAKEAVSNVVNSKLEQDIVLKKDDYETTITTSQIDAEFAVEEAVNEAYNVGRGDNIIINNYSIISTLFMNREIECNLNYDEEELDSKISDISSKLPGAVVDNSYYIEDDELIIVKGTEGLQVKSDELKEAIIELLNNVYDTNNVLDIPTETVSPGEIDVAAIREEIYKEAEDAYITEDPTTVHAEVEGVDFAISIEEAEAIVAEDQDEYVIPLTITEPETTLADLGEDAFPDKLATYSTRYDPSNENRSNNIELATEKIDGTILMPGETFSFNQTVGERTVSAGYKEASAYANGEVVQDIGGGICQTSSTLYNVVLLANLEITERSNHQFLTSYVSASRDATVSWGGIDFQFTNTRTYPIKIEAKAKNGVCKISIYGIKEEVEYEVVIESEVTSYISYTTEYVTDSSLEEGEEVVEQSGYTGCTSEAYRVLKLNGEVISRTLLSKDTYDPLTEIIRVGTSN